MKKDNIPDYPNFYISKRGRVWKRIRDGTWKELPYIKNPTRGYLYVSLSKGKKFRLNRLVAMIHIPNPNNLPIVIHLDNNIYNNHYKNLKWGTYKENTQQMMREGRNKGQFKPKLSESQLVEVVRLYDTGKYTLKSLSLRFNCKNMSRLVRRTRERSALSAVGIKN